MAPLKGLGTIAGIMIGGVWIFHGLYSKILGGIPRHQQIVERILGEDAGVPMTRAIGGLEILLGVWAISGRARGYRTFRNFRAIAYWIAGGIEIPIPATPSTH